MRTLRIALSLALALTLTAPEPFAGVAGATYMGDFNVNGSGDCKETTYAFDEDGTVRVSGCSAVYDGTFSQFDLFFIGFWSLTGSTGGSSVTQLKLSGIELYFGARIYGSGEAFGANVKIYGVLQPDGGVAVRTDDRAWTAFDPMRSPERI